VFFSTHILSDVERICDTVAILDEGRVVAQAPIDELKARYGAEKVIVEVESGADELAEAMGKRPWAAGISRPENGTIEAKVTNASQARREIPILVAQRRLSLVRMESGEMGLEEVFVQLVGGGQS
jgi:ABC-2 type transport system ATP-binding protein